MVQYYWDKYNTNSTTSTTYSNSHLVASGSSSASITGYPSYSFTSSGGYQGSGSSYSPAVGDTVYGILSSTVMIEYNVTSKVGSTCYYNYWRYECDSTPTTTYSRGSYISTIIADQYAYTNNARNSDGYWYVRGSQYVEPTPPPSAPTGVSVSQGYLYPDTEMFISWTAVSGVDLAGSGYYAVENVTTGQTHTLIKDTSHTWTGLNPGTTYGFRVSANRGDGAGWSNASSTVYGTTAAPIDRTPPTVTITGSNGNGQMSFSFSGSDASGINLYRVYISGANNSTFTEKAIVSPPSNSYSFSSDGNGLAFVNGSSYTMRVIAYDNNNNASSPADVTVTYQKIRPSNWTWSTLRDTTSITMNNASGKAPLVDATEWNNFCTRINDFRTYKNLSVVTFANRSSGSDFEAIAYNQAVNAINPMATVTTSSRPYTALLNLSSALNSIT